MASETKPEKSNVEDAMKDLKLDSPSEATDIQSSEGKDGRPSDVASCISSGDAMRSTKESEVDQEDFIAVPSMYYPVNDYYGYYYPGLSFGDWDDRGCFPGTAGLEVQHPAIQADNASAVYYFPGLQHGYTAYSPFLPGAIIGADGQYFGQEPYNPTPFFSQSLLSPGHLPQPVIYGPELIPAYTWETSIFSDGLYGNAFNGYLTAPSSKSNFPSRDSKFASSKYSALSKSDDLDKKGSSPTLYISPNRAAHNQPLKPVNKAAAVLSESVLPVNKFSSHSNHGNNSLLHPHSLINIKENGGYWAVTDKVKARNKTYMVGDSDTLNEQTRGPRTSNPKHNLISGIKPVGSLGTEKIGSSKTLTAAVKKEDYNLLDFPTKYDHTLFFVIKSYSEDDIHKSIKYNVWASTSNGNKRLDNAYQVAQEKMVEKGCKCPVFLFFSVNASGQFCGVAEMIGRVDFTKNMDFWQQDKWNGAFPVKWHIIKDVPNAQLRHIILENNDNRPVTNSRDTQEVRCLQGSEMLNIFKSYSSRTSILDDFDFYEHREKAMESRKTKPLIQSLKHSWSKTDETAQVKEPGDLTPSVSSLQSNESALTMTKEDLLVKG